MHSLIRRAIIREHAERCEANLEGKPTVGENTQHYLRAASRTRRIRQAYNETRLVARMAIPDQVRDDQRRLDQYAVEDLKLAA